MGILAFRLWICEPRVRDWLVTKNHAMPIQEPQYTCFEIPAHMADLLTKHAQEQGLTFEEASAELFARGIRKDFIRAPKVTGVVLPFRRR